MKDFLELVRESHKLVEEEEKANYLDEIFFGAIVTTLVDKGYILLNIYSDTNSHLFILEKDREKFGVSIYTKNHSVVEAKTVGCRALIKFFYGIPVKGLSDIFSRMKKLSLSKGLEDIGTISYEYENYYLYVSTILYLDINKYIDFETLDINYEQLEKDISSIISALKTYLTIG
ncbi:hypothetical protein ACPB8Q_00420 [Methanocaldococcus indicus]|uniref:hypothetical protein n=1 Tax=Methanocaldococcus indicus TaxID=213231 RepID=UPI003C6D7E3C